ncbi:MAG: Transcriptional regulator, MarR family [Ramlibacter sp.]|nr:Transcriptional regulator, MarR family [Ramlibacter sp.]
MSIQLINQGFGGKLTKEQRKRSATGAQDALEYGVLPRVLGRQLRMAHLHVVKDAAMEVDGTSLSHGSFEILELLSHNPGIGHSRLATAIGLEKSSLVPVIVRLECLALVDRKLSPIDKRANELRITAKGRKALTRLRRYVLERDARLVSAIGMSEAEVETLNRLLKQITSADASHR